jgi:hypothetical protein
LGGRQLIRGRLIDQVLHGIGCDRKAMQPKRLRDELRREDRHFPLQSAESDQSPSLVDFLVPVFGAKASRQNSRRDKNIFKYCFQDTTGKLAVCVV